jgi:hypothetical protein
VGEALVFIRVQEEIVLRRQFAELAHFLGYKKDLPWQHSM